MLNSLICYNIGELFYFKNIGGIKMPNIRRFKTGDEFLNAVKKYIKQCEKDKRIATIAGFCATIPMPRCTFYAQEKKYPFEYDISMSLLEDNAVNGRDAMSIFYLKNKFGYKDKIETESKIEGLEKYFVSDASEEE